MEQSRGDLRGRALRVTVGCMAAQMAMGAVYARAPLTPALIEEFGWTRGDMMLASTPGTWMTALASPVAGFLTQRYGARPVVTFGVIWVSILFWGFSHMQTLWQLFALNIGIGILVASVGDVAVGTVVSKWVARGRGLALGIVYSGSNLGGALASLAAGYLLVAVGWRDTYVWVGLATTLVLLPIVRWNVREPPEDFVPASLAAGDPAADVSSSTLIGIPLRAARRTPTFWLLGVSLFLFYLYFISVSAHLTLYLTDLGLSQKAAALNFSLMVALGVAAKLGIGLVANRWPAKTALMFNFAVVVLGAFLLVALERRPELRLLFIVTHGVATMAQNVVYPLIVAHCFGTRYMAEIYGVLMLALLPGGILGPVFAGYMYDWTGSYALVFKLYAGLTVVTFAMLAAVRREIGAEPPPGPLPNTDASSLP